MRVATIVPTPYLSVIKQDEYQMCLYQEVKAQPEYAEFYRDRAAEGMFVIMDNGAAEGSNPTWQDLLPVYALVNPSEVILPDVIYNKEETIRQTREAYSGFNQAGLKARYMMVPQGNTFKEWKECMETFVKQSPVTVGISKFVTPKFQDEMGPGANVRLECVDAIVEFCGGAKQMKEDGIQIHLLGCWDNPQEIGEIARAFGKTVRGTDSAIAYVYTRNGIEYDPTIDRPDKKEIDFELGDRVSWKLLENNKRLWVNYCNGNLEVM